MIEIWCQMNRANRNAWAMDIMHKLCVCACAAQSTICICSPFCVTLCLPLCLFTPSLLISSFFFCVHVCLYSLGLFATPHELFKLDSKTERERESSRTANQEQTLRSNSNRIVQTIRKWVNARRRGNDRNAEKEWEWKKNRRHVCVCVRSLHETDRRKDACRILDHFSIVIPTKNSRS